MRCSMLTILLCPSLSSPYPSVAANAAIRPCPRTAVSLAFSDSHTGMNPSPNIIRRRTLRSILRAQIIQLMAAAAESTAKTAVVSIQS